jgi:hypothetical protein
MIVIKHKVALEFLQNLYIKISKKNFKKNHFLILNKRTLSGIRLGCCCYIIKLFIEHILYRVTSNLLRLERVKENQCLKLGFVIPLEVNICIVLKA